jgi:chaperonin GroES
MKKSNKKTKSVKKVSKPVKKSTPKTTITPSPKIAKNSVGVAPLGDRVLVKALSPEESGTLTAFGIVIPDSSKEKPEQGTVVAVGPGKVTNDGTLMPLSVKVGDKIMFSKYGFDEIKVAGVEYLILPESSILAILE